MEIIGYFAAILIGFLLGLMGGGGSILTVPVLVYLMGTDPLLATGYSLFIVGFTSLVGGVKAFIQKQIDFRAVSLFGIPSILAIFLARHFILPAIPERLFQMGNIEVDKGKFLMLVFALLMLLTSLSMLKNLKETKTGDSEDSSAVPQYKLLALLIPGIVVGLTTGLLGAGGGFLIVPALVLLIGLPMKIAVGTSLLIIAINSLFGVVFSIGRYPFSWNLLLIFTALSVAGVFAGSALSGKMNNRTLKTLFGVFVLVMGVAIIVMELVF